MRIEVDESSMVSDLGGLWVWDGNKLKTLVASIKGNKWQVRREMENKMCVFALAGLPSFFFFFPFNCIFISRTDNQKKLRADFMRKGTWLDLSLLPATFQK